MGIDKHTAISAQLDFMPAKVEVAYQAQWGTGVHPDVRFLLHSLLVSTMSHLSSALDAGIFSVYDRMFRHHTVWKCS